MLGAEGVLSVFPELTSATEVGSVVVVGTVTARDRVWVFPVFGEVAGTRGVVVWGVLIGLATSVLLTKREDGVIVVWVVDILGSAGVEVVAAIAEEEPLLPVDEEWRSVAATVEMPAPEEDGVVDRSVSMAPGVSGCEEVAAVGAL